MCHLAPLCVTAADSAMYVCMYVLSAEWRVLSVTHVAYDSDSTVRCTVVGTVIVLFTCAVYPGLTYRVVSKARE